MGLEPGLEPRSRPCRAPGRSAARRRRCAGAARTACRPARASPPDRPSSGSCRRSTARARHRRRRRSGRRAPRSRRRAPCCAALRRAALASAPVGLRIRHEMEAVQVTDMLALDRDVAGGRDFRFEHRVLSQAPHQNAGAPVDEALGEPLMKRVRQLVLYLTRDALPMLGIRQPVGPIGDEGPGAHLRDAVRTGCRCRRRCGRPSRRWRENQSAGTAPSRIRKR